MKRWRKTITAFVRQNGRILGGMFIGLVLGYLFWLYVGIYSGSYPLSAEPWVNLIYGCLIGGFVSSLWVQERGR